MAPEAKITFIVTSDLSLENILPYRKPCTLRLIKDKAADDFLAFSPLHTARLWRFLILFFQLLS